MRARWVHGRKRLPEGSAWHAHKALRQVLAYAVRSKLVAENVAKAVPNPEPKRREVPVFGSWEELGRLAEELAPERQSLPIVVAGTGLTPEEWLGLERRDVDLKAGVLHVRRVYTDNRVKEYGKQDRSLRRIPLRDRVVEALEAHPWRIDTPLVFPGINGGYLNLHDWRVETRGRRRRAPPPYPVLAEAHVRVVRDRRRRQPVLPQSLARFERRPGLPNLRAHAPGVRGVPARATRHVRHCDEGGGAWLRTRFRMTERLSRRQHEARRYT